MKKEDTKSGGVIVFSGIVCSDDTRVWYLNDKGEVIDSFPIRMDDQSLVAPEAQGNKNPS